MKKILKSLYLLIEINGNVIQQNKIENKLKSVSFQDLANATYFI